jgi:hypothetical protein
MNMSPIPELGEFKDEQHLKMNMRTQAAVAELLGQLFSN